MIIDDLVSNRNLFTFTQAFVQYCLSKNLATSAIIRLLRAGVDKGSTAAATGALCPPLLEIEVEC